MEVKIKLNCQADVKLLKCETKISLKYQVHPIILSFAFQNKKCKGTLKIKSSVIV